MNILGIIPARGGSKGVLRKNIKDFCGMPLIAYTIQAAYKSKLSKVIVSTDDEEIAKIDTAVELADRIQMQEDSYLAAAITNESEYRKLYRSPEFWRIFKKDLLSALYVNDYLLVETLMNTACSLTIPVCLNKPIEMVRCLLTYSVDNEFRNIIRKNAIELLQNIVCLPTALSNYGYSQSSSSSMW
jgi:spore coat polysaccharide biosynthesis protein SpsF (cytidylyltransferase family)